MRWTKYINRIRSTIAMFTMVLAISPASATSFPGYNNFRNRGAVWQLLLSSNYARSSAYLVPILAWVNCIGNGRMFHSPVKYRPETCSQEQDLAMLAGKIGWVTAEKRASTAKALL